MIYVRKMFRICAFVWLCSLTHQVLAWQAPAVETIESPALARGATATLKIVGENLAGIQEVVFYERGVSCENIQVQDDGLVIQVSVAPDCDTGMHALRLRSDAGYSEMRTFCVTPFTVLKGEEVGDAVPLNTSILGRLNDSQADRYVVKLESGQRLSVDVEAIRLGIAMFDPAIIIRDPTGRVLAHVDDSALYRQDPIASILAKQPGDYLVEISDAGRNSREGAVYVMHLSDGPRPTSVFPLGGQPGRDIELTFRGDCLGDWTDTQTLPELSGGAQNWSLLAQRDGKYSATALPFRLSPLRNEFEASRNDDWLVASEHSVIEVPVALNGVIDQPLDRDCFWLQGVAGQRMNVDVFAYRLGSAADTLLSVVDSQQKLLASSDDVDSLDSRVEFLVPEDGRFGVAVEEKRGKSGEEFTYRVEIDLVRPTAEVFLPRRDRRSQDLQTVAVPQGNRVLALIAVRKDEASGETNIRFPELLPGITAHYVQPLADQAVVPVVFAAAADASLSGQLVPVEVSVYSPKGTAIGEFHQVTDLVNGPADAIYTEHHSNRLALSTRQPYPIAISVAQPQASLVQDGTLDLHVTIERQSGFEGDVILSLPWLPAWIDAQPRIIVPADQSQAVLQLRAWQQAEVATWPLVVEASAGQSSRRRRSRGGAANMSPAAAVNAGAVTSTQGDEAAATGLMTGAIASLPIQLSVTGPPATAQFEAAAAEQGEEIEVHCTLVAQKQLQKLTNLVASLEGLPNRVTCDPLALEAKSQIIRFEVKLEPTAPTGSYTGLACRLSGRLGDETVTYVVSRDGQLTIEETGKIQRDASGRPLNRLEALRQKTIK